MNWKNLIVLICIFFIYFDVANKPSDFFVPDIKDMEIFEQKLRLEELQYSEFSISNLKEFLILYGVADDLKDIIIRQAILETGAFTSNIFKESHNLFGMKHPKVRPTTSLGTNRGHAKYAHWSCSVKDYILWLDYFQARGHVIDNYYNFLRRVGYAEDPLYILKLKNLNLFDYT